MAAIPTIAEEDARRPNREHLILVQDRIRVVNRMKLIRFGIRTFNVMLCKAADRLATLRGPEDEHCRRTRSPSCAASMARLSLIREQIKTIEAARLDRLKRAPRKGTHPMLLMLAQIMGIGVQSLASSLSNL